MRRNWGRGKVGVEQHIATTRYVKFSAKRELLDQRSNSIKLSLMAELLEVDVVEGKSVVAQVGEDVFEEVGVPVGSKATYSFLAFWIFSNLSINIAPVSSLLVCILPLRRPVKNVSCT